MKYIITGATSFIGLELVNYLLSQNHEIVAICRPDSKGLAKLPKSLDVVFADMSDYHTLNEKIDKADVFVNLAWEGTGHGGRNVTDIQKENIKNTIDAFISASKMGCRVFVEAGSQAEYGTVTTVISEETPCNPFSEYGKSKLEVKSKCFELAESFNMKYIHLRIFSIFGENDHPWTLVMFAIDKMKRNEKVDLSPCTQKWNFLYVKDAVKCIAKLCDYAMGKSDFIHEVYNIASRDTRTLKDFVEEIKTIIKSSSVLNYGAVIPQNLVSLNPDVSKTESATGFKEYTPFHKVINNIIKSKN